MNSIEFMAFIDLSIHYDEFVSLNNVLREYDNVKEEIKNLKTSSVCLKAFNLFIK